MQPTTTHANASNLRSGVQTHAASNRRERLPTLVIGRRLALAAGAVLALAVPTSTAHACNPYKLVFTTTGAPDNPVAGNLVYQIRTSCSSSTKPKCNGIFPLPTVRTPIRTKCTKLYESIRDTCGLTAVVENRCLLEAAPTIVLTDPVCNQQLGTPGEGMTMVLANSGPALQAGQTTTNMLLDYERDLITPDCPAASGAVILKNTASGQSISGDSQANVVVTVSAGTDSVTERVVTAAGDTPQTVLTKIADLVNLDPPAGVQCQVDPVSQRALVCDSSAGAAPLNSFTAAAAAVPVSVSIQSDDTALVKAQVIGPSEVVHALVATIDTPQAEVVGPPPGPQSTPSAGTWVLICLAAAFLLALASSQRPLLRAGS